MYNGIVEAYPHIKVRNIDYMPHIVLAARCTICDELFNSKKEKVQDFIDRHKSCVDRNETKTCLQ